MIQKIKDFFNRLFKKEQKAVEEPKMMMQEEAMEKASQPVIPQAPVEKKAQEPMAKPVEQKMEKPQVLEEVKKEEEKPKTSAPTQELKETKTTSKKQVSKMDEEDDFAKMFGVDLEVIGIGDVVDVQIYNKDAQYYNATVVSNAQEVVIPFDELVSENPNDIIKVKVYKYYKDNLYASEKMLQKKMSPMKKQGGIDASQYQPGEIVRGKIISFKEPFYRIEVDGQIFNMLKYRVDCPPIMDFKKYVGKVFDFEIVGHRHDEKINRTFVEFSRKNLALQKRQEAVNNIAVGSVINIDTPTLITGGLQTIQDDVRIFIPFVEMAHGGNTLNAQNVFEHLSFPLDIKVINKTDDTLICSIKALMPDPLDEFLKQEHGDEVFNGKILRHYDYGILLEIKPGIKGMLGFNKIDENRVNELKQKEVNTCIDVKISNINQMKKTIDLMES